MKQERIKEILRNITRVNVAVYGDFCLDAYWIMDPEGSEISLETGKRAEAVRKHYYSPGGASNIAANLVALRPASIRAIGVIGNDIFGRELIRILSSLNIETPGLIIQLEDFNTYTFTKKYRDEEEEPRIDFGIFNKRTRETDEIILDLIRKALRDCDILVFNQQFPGSITNPEFIENVNQVFMEFNDKIVLLDSRHYNDRFRNVYRKTNVIEIARMNGQVFLPADYISLKKAGDFARKVFEQSHKPVFVTCGVRGLLSCDETGLGETGGIQFLKRLDTVGAGDTVMSALALCLACGVKPHEAADFANLAAAVTVQKLFITGTACGDEILSVALEPDRIYNPDFAFEPGTALFIPGTKIEVCDKEFISRKFRIRHAVFDHDGTISTLRHGWERVMEKMMIDAIAGNPPAETAGRIMRKIRERVVEYIEKSTGIQTIQQMEALAEMVREFNRVPREQQFDKFEYKKIYNKALLDNIRGRLSQVRENLFMREDYIIPGAVEFLKSLRESGITLYLASGTDKKYVDDEAGALGYASLFDGGIYGALDDISLFSKKMVIEKIIKENHLKGEELVVFGDGPVEIRESRKCGGLAIGLATDEEKMTGINYRKRERLILAGAQFIIPEFNESDALIDLLVN